MRNEGIKAVDIKRNVCSGVTGGCVNILPVFKSDSARFVVGGHDNKGVSVPFCVIKGGCNSTVKGEQSLLHSLAVVAVVMFIYVGALNHQEKAVFAIVKQVDGFFCHLSEGRHIAAIAFPQFAAELTERASALAECCH